MAILDGNTDRNDAINRLAETADLAEVAGWLGMTVVGEGSHDPKALCPFHNDRKPSLHLYKAEGGARSRFHCYVCSAHGDVFDLVKRQLNVDFLESLEWLSGRYRMPIPERSNGSRRLMISPRDEGLATGFEILKKTVPDEAECLRFFAEERGIDINILKKAGVFPVLTQKISRILEGGSREKLDQFRAAGLIREYRPAGESGATSLPLEYPTRDFYNTPRILFTLRNDRGSVEGFCGRAIGNEAPKYLFSPGVRRSSFLYRFDQVRSVAPPRSSKKNRSCVDLFLVEGFMDALRLESFGLKAAGIMGSYVTDAQIALLVEYARDLARKNVDLFVHCFLDQDSAGKSGTVKAVLRLLEMAVEEPSLHVDAVMPSLSNGGDESVLKKDPDSLLEGLGANVDVLKHLKAWIVSPMEVLLVDAVGPVNNSIEKTWAEMSRSEQLRACRLIEERLGSELWQKTLERVDVFGVTIKQGEGSEENWAQSVERFLKSSKKSVSEADGLFPIAGTKSKEAHLTRALQIAEASTQRREFPVDENSWDRLRIAIDVSLLQFQELLGKPAGELRKDLGVMLPAFVPKGDSGDFRMKALPGPELLTLQQYVLDELLRHHSAAPRFTDLVPAVRLISGSGRKKLVTTGPPDLVPHGGETVSFAYALDMDVVDQLSPPKSTGMYRSYYECWRSFISFIESRLSLFPASEELYVARLDVRSFYPSVTRPVVNSVLLSSLKSAFREFEGTGIDGLPETCASLLLPDVADPEKRAEGVVDWLCDLSFDYAVENESAVYQGLPQGPDLSAYLANISLFPLDRALSKLVYALDCNASSGSGNVDLPGEIPRVKGAVYARYVDDMILIARSAEDLAVMRRAVEQQLVVVGMELSPKTRLIDPMPMSKVLEWLTDKRGAGLGVSAPLDEPPSSTPLALLEPLADAGEIDRSDSLRILHDPTIQDPDVRADQLLQAVELSLGASDLRHADRASAASLLWRYAFLSITGSSDEIRLLIAEFSEKWNEFSAPYIASKEKINEINLSKLLAWLDGIDRLLRTRRDRDPRFSTEKHKENFRLRKRLANLVHGGLCHQLLESLSSGGFPKRFSYFLDLKITSIQILAAHVVDPGNDAVKPSAAYSKLGGMRRLLISYSEILRSFGIFEMASSSDNEIDPILLFHESVARLRSFVPGTGSLDPLFFLTDGLKAWQKVNLGGVTSIVLSLWERDRDDTDDFSNVDFAIKRAALNSLINIAPENACDLLQQRTELRSHAFSGKGEAQDVHLIPSPPGLKNPGLVALRNPDFNEVIRIDFRVPDSGDQGATSQAFFPSLDWTPSVVPEASDHFLSYRADLASGYLRPPDSIDLNAQTIRWVSRAFRGFTEALSLLGDDYTYPLTALNLLGPSPDDGGSGEGFGFIGFGVSRNLAGNQAYIRQGSGGLMIEGIPENYRQFWRVGVALSDWLGRAQSSRSISSVKLAAAPLISQNQRDWILEGVLRLSLARLRGTGLPAKNLKLCRSSGLPLTIERVLKQLDTFPDKENDKADNYRLAHFLAMLVEGRAIHIRSSSNIDVASPGGGTAMLVDLVRTQFKADEEMAKHLPQVELLRRKNLPERRPVLALYTLSARLASLSKDGSHEVVKTTLDALTAGVRIWSLETQLRSQALELWYLVPEDSRSKLQNLAPTIGEWDLDGQVLLHRDQAGSSSQLKGVFVEENVRELFGRLIQSTKPNTRVNWESLSGVTPLGWLVVIGSITGLIKGGWSEGLLSVSNFPKDGEVGLKNLAQILAIEAEDLDDPPWAGLEQIITIWSAATLDQSFEVLSLIDDAVGILIETHEGSRFNVSPSRGGPTEINSSTGVWEMPAWSVATASVSGGQGRGIERVVTEEGRPILNRWSESWVGDRLVAIGVVQPGMVDLAGRGFSQKDMGPGFTVEDRQRREVNGDEDAEESPNEPPSASSKPDVEVLPENVQVKQAQEHIPDSLTKDKDSKEAQISESIDHLKRLQEVAWNKRSDKSKGHLRTAFLQWHLDGSYFHPKGDVCVNSKDSDSAFRESCIEGRRRNILESVLLACQKFKVDVLVLPEYSVRPETVEWLLRRVKETKGQTSIWAGTYRQPPGLQNPKDRERSWAAILEAIIVNEGKEPELLLPRLKKYPAVGVDEKFNPSGVPLSPIFDATKRSDLRGHITELICSEMFLAAFPGNVLPLAEGRRELLKKFGSNTKTDKETVLEDAFADVRSFAKSTSIAQPSAERRTVILLPAMTSRSEDYSIFGQAAFLASGLTTVFCNAVAPPYGNGKSCFIGHDGWLNAAKKPTDSPYHGVEPGIFKICSEKCGRLGKDEEALVIADIDPVYAFEGKPRPQTLPRPLQLVAHLPIIEAVNSIEYNGFEETRSDAIAKGKEKKCICEKTWSLQEKAWSFVPQLLAALIEGIDAKWNTTLEDITSTKMDESLDKLALSGGGKGSGESAWGWLNERRLAYLENRVNDPQPWPPPVAVDWLLVDPFKKSRSGVFPELEIPSAD